MHVCLLKGQLERELLQPDVVQVRKGGHNHLLIAACCAELKIIYRDGRVRPLMLVGVPESFVCWSRKTNPQGLLGQNSGLESSWLGPVATKLSARWTAPPRRFRLTAPPTPTASLVHDVETFWQFGTEAFQQLTAAPCVLFHNIRVLCPASGQNMPGVCLGLLHQELPKIQFCWMEARAALTKEHTAGPTTFPLQTHLLLT